MEGPFRIAIAGLGTVGTGVIQILQTHEKSVAARAQRPVKIVAVSAKNKNKDRGVDLSGYDWEDDPVALAFRDDVDCVLELIGGEGGAALDLTRKALENGKHVVTANKAMLAHHGLELAKIAEKNNRALSYEAAVAGGIPVIRTIREGIACNDIQAAYGILNGTCNYILTQMRLSGRAFDDVLKEAQELGYAEADPGVDIDGVDAGHKLSLLVALCFGVQPDFASLEMTGIRDITAGDISAAGELGYKIKLLGSARKIDNGKIAQSLEPVLVPVDAPIASVEDVYNAVVVQGDFVGKVMMEGRGAGGGPTATSVVADMTDLARGEFRPIFGIEAESLLKADKAGDDEIISSYYLRLTTKDEPGVLADIAACLRDEKISIQTLHQDEHGGAGPASVIITTYAVSKAAMKRAVKALDGLSVMEGKAMALRIDDMTRHGV